MGSIYISDLFPREEMRALIEESGAGVETIRFSVGDNLDDFERQMQAAGEELAFLGNPALTLHGPFLDLNPASYDSEIRRVTRRRMEQAYRAARTLGAAKMICHSCRVPATVYLEGWAERIAGFYEEFLEDKRGIQVLMENVFDPEYDGILQAAEMVKHPDFGLCLDLGHAHCFSEYPVTEWARRLAGHIRHVHVHDNGGVRDEHLALGQGSLPVAETVRLIQKYNENVTWTIECTSRRDAEASLRVLENCISGASVIE